MPKKTFETNEQAQDAVYFYLLNYSRSKHKFPDISRRVERKLGIDGRTYNLNFRAIKEQVVRHRVDEILRKKDATKNEIEKELGIGIYNYLDALGGYETFSDLFFAYRGKKTRRKFATREEALNAFRTRVEKDILDGQYKDQVDIQSKSKVGTPAEIYDVNWRKNVLDFVHDKLIKGELEKNPRITLKALWQKHPFALETARRAGSFTKLKRKLGILYKSHSNREELLENCTKAKKILGEKASRKNIQKEVGACLSYWKIAMEEIDPRTKFVNSMTGDTIEEKDKKLRNYVNLIRQVVKPKPKSRTTEEDMWEFINQKTGIPPNTFDVTNAKNYLLYTEELEGSKLNGGYWKHDK